MIRPYKEVGERMVMANPSEPLVPYKLDPLELRTAIEGPRATGRRIASSRDSELLLRAHALPDLPFLVCLNAKNEPLVASSLGEPGSLDELTQDVLALTLLSGAVAAVFFSPHPDAHDIEYASGIEDRSLVEMGDAFQLVGLSLLDIILFNDDGHVSFLDIGAM